MNYQLFQTLTQDTDTYLFQLPPEIIEFYLLRYLTTKTDNTYKLFGQLHSPTYIENEQIQSLPAIIKSNGTKKWYFNGQLHRDNDQPAVISINSSQDQPHQDFLTSYIRDRQAILYDFVNKYYYQHGKLHRNNDQPAIILADDAQYWYQHHKRHRENDLPACLLPCGEARWYQFDELHRENDLPAIVEANGTKRWYKNDKLHRDTYCSYSGQLMDQPAIINVNGTKKWYQHGKLHRDTICPLSGQTLPAIIDAKGNQHWYQNNKLHRDNDLPAIIKTSGTQKWYKHGKLHRDNQPGIIKKSGYRAWCTNDNIYYIATMQLWDFQTLIQNPKSYLSRLPNDIIEFFLLNYLITKTDNKYTLFDRLHSPKTIENGQICDKPALIHEDGTQEWYSNGQLHRDTRCPISGQTLPAVVYPSGARYWLQYDKYHRDDDLPARIHSGGIQEWYSNGQLHRNTLCPISGQTLPAIIHTNGTLEYYKHGIKYEP